jgi:hypothetical protein
MELKTSLKEIPLVNDKILAETARQCKVSESTVEEFVNFVGTYTADVMRTGAMESVMWPYLGKFRPKEKVVNYFNKKSQNKKNGKDIIYRAMKGRNIETKPKDDVI